MGGPLECLCRSCRNLRQQDQPRQTQYVRGHFHAARVLGCLAESIRRRHTRWKHLQFGSMVMLVNGSSSVDSARMPSSRTDGKVPCPTAGRVPSDIDATGPVPLHPLGWNVAASFGAIRHVSILETDAGCHPMQCKSW